MRTLEQITYLIEKVYAPGDEIEACADAQDEWDRYEDYVLQDYDDEGLKIQLTVSDFQTYIDS